jgi:hypothetical protein
MLTDLDWDLDLEPRSSNITVSGIFDCPKHLHKVADIPNERTFKPTPRSKHSQSFLLGDMHATRTERLVMQLRGIAG